MQSYTVFANGECIFHMSNLIIPFNPYYRFGLFHFEEGEGYRVGFVEPPQSDGKYIKRISHSSLSQLHLEKQKHINYKFRGNGWVSCSFSCLAREKSTQLRSSDSAREEQVVIKVQSVGFFIIIRQQTQNIISAQLANGGFSFEWGARGSTEEDFGDGENIIQLRKCSFSSTKHTRHGSFCQRMYYSLYYSYMYLLPHSFTFELLWP